MKAPANELLLDVRDLEIRYGAATAVRGVNLNVRRGELVAVIGNNGAGKTSILRGICGLVRPSAGNIVFKGVETARLGPHRKVALGLVTIPEGRLIFADQTVADNLILGAYNRWHSERAAVESDFERVLALFPRLKERYLQRAGSLSGGEQQMLAIARGLLAKPDLLMIDELSLGLAPKIVEQLMGLLVSLFSWDTAHIQPQHHVLFNCSPRQEQRLLRHVATFPGTNSISITIDCYHS